MASFGHLAVGIAAGRSFAGRDAKRGPLLKAMAAFCAVAMWPDADFFGMVAGIPYESPFGHRGATHSFVAALAVAAASLGVAKWLRLPPLRTALTTGLVAVSHGLLDTLTTGGGLGCALLWPFSLERLWSPVRFIPVAPLGLGMISRYGLYVASVELAMFSPLLLYAVWWRSRARGLGL